MVRRIRRIVKIRLKVLDGPGTNCCAEGFYRGLATGIWSEMGVGFGILSNGNELERMEEAIEVERKGIGRVWQGIRGFRR